MEPNERPKHWSQEPKRLMEIILQDRQDYAHEHDESRVALALCHARPKSTDVGVAARTGDMRSYRIRAHNLLHEGASSVQAFICANRLEARITTLAGTSDSERAAELFNQAVNQTFEEQDFQSIESKVFWDAELCTAGYGMAEVCPITGNPLLSRLEPLETWVNPGKTEARTVRYLDRRVVRARYGKTDEQRDAIDHLPRMSAEYISGVDSNTSHDRQDTVAVYEGWTKTLGDDKGKHVVQLSEDFVIVEPWDLPVPVAKQIYEDGFRDGEGRSLARTLVPYATRQNAFAAVKLDQLEGARTYVKRSANVEFKADNANWIDVQVPEGNEPYTLEIVIPKTVSADIQQAEKDQHDEGLQEAGVSSDFASGEPPPQYASQVALLEWKKSLTQRLSQPQRHREAFWLDMCKILAAILPKAYESKPIRLKAANTELWEEIQWSAIGPEKSFNISYQLRSGQALNDSGRLELVNTFKDSKAIDELDALAQMSNPDVQRLATRALAKRRLIEHQISAARDGKPSKLIAPIDGQDFAYAAEACSSAFQAAYMRGIYTKQQMQNLWILWQLFLARIKATPPVLPPSGDISPEAAAAVLPPASAPEVVPPAPGEPNAVPVDDTLSTVG